MLELRPLKIPDVVEIRPSRIGDERGFFSEVWSAEAMAAVGLKCTFVQDNHSYSAARGVLRGLHFQRPPFAQDKLVRVSRGSIFDVAVDLRQESPTFGEWVGLVVSADRWNQVLVPKGFAHGFLTLEEHTEVQYKVTVPYSPQNDRSVSFRDPALSIDWPISENQLQLSPKDRAAPLLSEVETGF